jgi:hypothetical protein
MLGRKNYTQAELDHNKAVIGAQLATYRALETAAGEAKDPKVRAALESFEPLFFNNLLLALDRPFVHRVRPVTGKDGNPLNEVEMICDALMLHDGIFTKSTVLKMVPDQSVLELQFGDPIRLSADQFERLSAAFFDELERKFC